MDELRDMLLERGAALVGYADLGALSAEVRGGLPRGVSIAVALDPAIIAGIAGGPTREYLDLYHRVNRFLDELAEAAVEFLQGEGARAEALASTGVGVEGATLSTRLPHKTVATRAGLGWIGKCALLITERYGSAVRFVTVLTDADLPLGDAIDASRCGDCAACVEVCAAGAPSGTNWQVGMERGDFFDAFACRDWSRERARRAGDEIYICGMCIAACPYTCAYLKRSGL